VSRIEMLGLAVFLAGTVLFFAWVLILTIRR
jgi:hypothetical protein